MFSELRLVILVDQKFEDFICQLTVRLCTNYIVNLIIP